MKRQHATMGWFTNSSATYYQGETPLMFEAGVLHPNTFNGEIFYRLCDKITNEKFWLLKDHNHNDLSKIYNEAFKPLYQAWLSDNGELLFYKYLNDRKVKNKDELTYERVMSFLAMLDWFVQSTNASLLFCC